LRMGGDAGAAADQFDTRAFVDLDVPPDPPQQRGGEQPRHRTADDDSAALAAFHGEVPAMGSLHGHLAGMVIFVPGTRLSCHAEREFAMKTRMSAVPIVVAALATASFFATPCAAMPAAALSTASVEMPIQKANGVRRHYRHFHVRHPLLEVYPGLYYGCRPG